MAFKIVLREIISSHEQNLVLLHRESEWIHRHNFSFNMILEVDRAIAYAYEFEHLTQLKHCLSHI